VSNFDDYASDYEERMHQTLSIALTSEEYQAEYKSKLIQRYASSQRKILNILDFGCGVGLSVPSLKAVFPKSQIFLTDVSQVSLNVAKKKHPDVTVLSPDLKTDQRFDVIFLSTVLHHITAKDRVEVIQKLKSRLSENGCIFIVEHNTYNPLTLKIVANCEMDQDAELISIKDLKRLLTSACSLRIADSGFCSFFPQPLKALAKADRAMKYLPLGGQYFIVAVA
jgi:2-polyprenyl-3-methyl-5-hydroxy-6-metoxy-1,4-benzoquinol methylase